MFTIVFVLLAYLIGSVSFAVLVSKGFGLPDPHTYGSKNPGATNVLRTGKKLPAILTLLGDGTKGWFAVLLADYFLPGVTVNEWSLAAVALAVFLGHLFPVFHRFAGGKGVATALGILLALHPWVGLCVLVVWLVMAFTVRISSLSALVAALSAPFFAAYFLGITPLFEVVVIISALLMWRHKSNIQKLLSGKEGKIGR